jgi:hypothetical protein
VPGFNGPTPSEVLASVRARLQQNEPAAAPPARPPMPELPTMAPPLQSASPAAPMTPLPPSPAPPLNPASLSIDPDRQSQRPAAGPSLNKPPLPFPARPIAASDGPPRPALPRPTTANSSSTLPSLEPSLEPWPEAADRLPPPLPPSMPMAAGDDYAGAPYPEYDAYAPHAPYAAPTMPQGGPIGGNRPAIHLDTARLVEHFARTVWIGESLVIELALPREVLEALALTPESRFSTPFATRAISIRLRAQDGACFVEPLTNETQWVENTQGLVTGEMIVWRWSLTGRKRGTAHLLVQIAVRTIANDGLSTDAQLPDQPFALRGRMRIGTRLLRMAGWVAAILGGIVLGFAVSGVMKAVFPGLAGMLGG